jgi:hypothetical protein
MIVNIIAQIALYLISSALAARNAPPPPEAGEIEINRTGSGKRQSEVFGTEWVPPECIWYGDGKTKPIRVSGGK